MAKTYVPSLRKKFTDAQKFATRYQPQLDQTLTDLQRQCLADAVTAILTCLSALGPKPIDP